MVELENHVPLLIDKRFPPQERLLHLQRNSRLSHGHQLHVVIRRVGTLALLWQHPLLLQEFNRIFFGDREREHVHFEREAV